MSDASTPAAPQALQVGQFAEVSRTVTDAHVRAFAELTGDNNPVHLDEAFAATTRFGGRIAHGMLGAGLISAAIATRLPGPGSIYLGQSLRFTAPVRLGDTITTRIEVLEVIRRRVRLGTVCRNQHGETVIDGEATVMIPG